MARPRKPTSLLVVTGTKNPGRLKARANEPQPVGDVGEPPAHLSTEAAAAWHEVVGLAHAGTLCRADRLIMEMLSSLLVRLREIGWRDPSLMLRFEAGLARLGLTPADRSRISTAPVRPAPPPPGRPGNDYFT